MTDNCDMNLFDPENMEIMPGKIDLFIPVGSKMTVSASIDSLYCIGLRASGRDVNLKMSREQVVKLARGILTLTGEEVKQGEWIKKGLYGNGTAFAPFLDVYECSMCKEQTTILVNFCPNCGARMGGEKK